MLDSKDPPIILRNTFFDYGHNLLMDGRPDEALEQFDKCLQVDPKFVVAHEHKCLVLDRKKKYPELLDAATEGIKNDPNSIPLLGYHGVARAHASKDLEGALKSIDRAVSLTKDENAKIHLTSNKGDCFLACGKFDEALRCFDIVLSKNPDHFNSLFGKAQVFIKVKRHTKAIEELQKCLEKRPGEPRSTAMMANSLSLTDQHSKALQYYDQAIAAGIMCFSGRAHALVELKRYKEALEGFEMALKKEAKTEEETRLIQQNIQVIKELL